MTVEISYNVDGRALPADAEGFLRNVEDWSPEAARIIAEAEGITLTDAHWEIISFLRAYYERHGIAPAVRVLTRVLERALGPGKADTVRLYGLFPQGPAKQASKIAGLPKPAGCM